MPAIPLLELSAVSYVINGQRILQSVHWRVEPHQHWALLGRNGAGKTTLLRIACGYLWPNGGGYVLRNGRRLTDLRTLRRSIGWVTSTLNEQIPPGEPAVDTVVSGRYAGFGLRRLPMKRPPESDYRDAREHMHRLGMAGLEHQPFGTLSQGERQKTLLARACMAGPMLLVLDEPCAGLDPASRESFLKTLQELAVSGAAPAMVLVTHHVEEIMPAFARLLVLDQGRVVASGSTEQLLDDQLVGRLYDGAVSRLVRHNGRCWPIGC